MKTVFVENLNSPFGMALVGSELYIADTDALLKLPYKDLGVRPRNRPGPRIRERVAQPARHGVARQAPVDCVQRARRTGLRLSGPAAADSKLRLRHKGSKFVRHRLLSILAADAAGYSRLMADDDRATVVALDSARAVFRDRIESADGRIVDMAGDSVLAVFDTAAGAVNAAIAIQEQLEAGSAAPDEKRLRFRIGVHLGDVIEKEDGSVYGDGVNIAARLQGLAEPGGINVSQAVHGLVQSKLPWGCVELGEQQVKNIAQPVRVYRIRRSSQEALCFGRFEILPCERALLIDGKPALVASRAFELLLELAKRPDQVLAKHQLMDLLSVEEGELQQDASLLRKLLGSEVVGIIPGRGFRFSVRLGDVRLATAIEAVPTLKTNLPERLDALIGRGDDLAALAAFVDRHSFVTIVGAGGVGKTRLAQALLQQRRDDGVSYPHGVCWVELAPVSDPDALPGVVATALGVHIGSGDPLVGLVAAAAPLTLLVALDNAEHLLAGVAQLVEALHRGAPCVKLLVTSQVPLKLSAERVYRLGALTVPAGRVGPDEAIGYGAVALFVERAQAADRRFVLDDRNVEMVIELCRRLDGLALAIELAAARVRVLGMAGIATSLDHRLRVLTDGQRTAPARQQTLRAALEWSHALLTVGEQAVFRRLAVVAGSCSLELAQQVAADHGGEEVIDKWSVLEALGGLVERSLVDVMPSEPLRYRLLDSPRAYALERLRGSGEMDETRQRHAVAVSEMFEAAWDERWGGRIGFVEWGEMLEPDLDNLRQAFAWSNGRQDAAMALAVGATLMLALPKSLYGERMALADRCESLMNPNLPPMLRMKACLVMSPLWSNTRPHRSHEAARQALSVAERSGAGNNDRFCRYLAHAWCALACARLNNVEAAEKSLVEMRALEDESWPPQRRLVAAEAEYFCAGSCGEPASALCSARKTMTLAKAAGYSGFVQLGNLVDAELGAGEIAAAVSTGAALVEQLQETRDEESLTYARVNLLAATLALGDAERARVVARAGWPHAPRFDHQPVWADYLALLAALEGRNEDSARLAGFSHAGYTRHERMRETNEAGAFERAARLARPRLGDAAYERLFAEGTRLRDEEIAAVAFGAVAGDDGNKEATRRSDGRR